MVWFSTTTFRAGRLVEVRRYDLKPEDQVYVRRCMYHNIRRDETNLLQSDAMLRFYEIRRDVTNL